MSDYVAVHYRDGSVIDGGLLHHIVDFAHSTPWLQPLMFGLSYGEIPIIAILLILGWYYARTGNRTHMAIVASTVTLMCVAVALSLVVKKTVHELRPCHSMHTALITECPHSISNYSFPSNHTIIAFSCATGLWLLHRRLGLLAGIMAVAIALSRMYRGAHYPHDVLVGAIAGIVLVLLAMPSCVKFYERKVFPRIEKTVLAKLFHLR